MKTLYWKTRPLRLDAAGCRCLHWPGVALNLALALVLVSLPVCGLVLAGLDGNFAELWSLADALLPIIMTWALALFALGFGYRLTAPLERLPGEQGEPPAQRTSRWFHWVSLRAVLFGGLAAATVLAAAFTLSGWQGRRAWEGYRAEAEKRGVVFDLEKLMPPPVPEAENFAATPLLRKFQPANPEWKEFRYSTNYNVRTATPVRPDDLSPKMPTPNAKQWFDGQLTDLAAWQTYYRASTNWPKWPEPREPAADVLRALSRWDSELAELAEAGRRHRCRFNLLVTEDGFSTLLPHYSVLQKAAETLRLRAVARFTAGQTTEAFNDVNLTFRLSESIANEPWLISHLVRIALHTQGLRTVWEGLESHRWTDAQLAHWQSDLAKRNFADELRHAMAGERASGSRAFEFLRRKPEMWPVLFNESETDGLPKTELVMHAVPAGWFFREQLSYHRLFDDFIVTALPNGAGKFDAALIRAKSAAMTNEIKREHRPPAAILRHRVLSNLLLPALEKAMLRASQAQAFTHLAIAACTLERHRLARGSYPESLGALAPELAKQIPLDPMSGQPFRYERTADGRFRLWSIGWNSKDDGGTVAMRELNKKELDFEQGDWVWPVPAK
ncbi:MAG: hypothetical protein B9S33_13490 [Pedosphaera sp. Tous-C6FEB]|nr:MAG: hypothetical protein B9S33_13490 [Pedosphaera sp. Tous-C6FEB]